MPQISPMKWMFLNFLGVLSVTQAISLFNPKVSLKSFDIKTSAINTKISWKW